MTLSTLATAAVALAVLVLVLIERRRVTAIRGALEGQSRTVDMLMMALDRHEHRLKVHAAMIDGLTELVCGEVPSVASSPALELIEGGCPDTPAGLESVAAPSRRVALTVVAR